MTIKTADELLTPREVALIFKVHVATLEGWRNMKTGPKYIKLGNGSRAPVRYRRGDIEAYLEGQAK